MTDSFVDEEAAQPPREKLPHLVKQFILILDHRPVPRDRRFQEFRQTDRRPVRQLDPDHPEGLPAQRIRVGRTRRGQADGKASDDGIGLVGQADQDPRLVCGRASWAWRGM